MEWIERPTVTYVFLGSETIKLETDDVARQVRGKCVAYARQLDDGSWEAKLTGPKHKPQPAVSRPDAHRKLKGLVSSGGTSTR